MSVSSTDIFAFISVDLSKFQPAIADHLMMTSNGPETSLSRTGTSTFTLDEFLEQLESAGVIRLREAVV